MKPLLLTLGFVLTAAALCLWKSDWRAQDACLDGGGRWSQAAAACEH